LRDPDNLDFRPQVGSFLGETCIGAYSSALSHGDEYLIAGAMAWRASTPVPPDGATNVKEDADLMFLTGLEAVGHKVYAGTSPTSLALLGSLEGVANIFTPSEGGFVLAAGATVYWRVDAYDAVHEREGPVWSFTVEDGTTTATTTDVPLCQTVSSPNTPIDYFSTDADSSGKFDVDTITIPAAGSLHEEKVEVTSLQVCVDLSVNTSLSDWHMRAYFIYGSGATWAAHMTVLDPTTKKYQGDAVSAKTYTGTCFGAVLDNNPEYVPSDYLGKSIGTPTSMWESHEPFTGLWKPKNGNMLTGFGSNTPSHAVENTEIQLRLRLYDKRDTVGTVGVSWGTLSSFSASMCARKLPAASRSEWPACPA
jgi:hypothetical protein